MPAQRVLVGCLDLVGQVGEELHAGEPEQAQQLVAGGVGAGELLVGLGEVGFQRVDRFQAHRDPAGVEVGWVPERRGRVSTRAGVSGWNLIVSPSGSGPWRGRSG
jgi:hypothetical protein